MSDLLEDAIARLRALPEAEQEAYAAVLLGLLHEEQDADVLSVEELEQVKAALLAPRREATSENVALAFRRSGQ